MSTISPEERPGGTMGLTEGEPQVVMNPTEQQLDTTGTADIDPKIKEAIFGKNPEEQDVDPNTVRPQDMAEFASASNAAGVVIDPDTGGRMEVGLPETDKPVDAVAVTERGS